VPKKVLGNDPFARASTTGKTQGAKIKKGTGRKRPAKTAVANAGKKGQSRRRVKLLEPSSKATTPATERDTEEKIEERIRLFEKRVGGALYDSDESDEQERDSDGAQSPRNRRRRRIDLASESGADWLEEDLDWDSMAESSDEEERGMLGQLVENLFLRKLGRSMGRRRLRTRSEDVDEFGKDPVYAERLEPLFEWLYQNYWRVEAEDIDNIPKRGKTLLVANHSGLLPFDGMMISEAVRLESELERGVRFLFDDELGSIPFLSPFMTRIGAVQACEENAERLLDDGQLVCMFPEGPRGTRKPYDEKYQLQDFGEGEFIRVCMRKKAALVPVAVVGAEETYPVIAKCKLIGKPFGLRFFPITPSWPILGPLGLVPLPSKWTIRFGKPIRFGKYGKEAAEKETLVGKLQEDVRDTIQDMVDEMLAERESIWLG